MASAGRMDVLFKGLAHRKQTGLTEHEATIKDLKIKEESITRSIAEAMQERELLNKDFKNAEKTAAALIAERMELESTLQASTAENEALKTELQSLQVKLADVKDTTKQQKQTFVSECKKYDEEIRRLKEMHPGCSFLPISSNPVPENDTENGSDMSVHA